MKTRDEDAQAHLLELLVGPWGQVAHRRRVVSIALFLLIWAWILASFARAGFTKIINSPPTEFKRWGTVESNTQVNFYPGGVLPGGEDLGCQ